MFMLTRLFCGGGKTDEVVLLNAELCTLMKTIIRQVASPEISSWQLADTDNAAFVYTVGLCVCNGTRLLVSLKCTLQIAFTTKFSCFQSFEFPLVKKMH